ncbi:MAG: hypothetical protein ACE5NC_00780 [Anaerolineae bacterium]
MRGLIAVWAILVAAPLVSACASTPTSTDSLSVIQTYFHARNAGDLDGAMALVADDAMFIVGPVIYRGSFHTGTAEIRVLHEGEEGRNTRFEVSNLLLDDSEADRDTIDGSLYVTTDIDEGWAHFEAIVQEGKIVALHRFEGKILERL